MKMKYATAFLGSAGMMALILDGQTALQGAGAAMALCIRTVIPSLFPFLFFCSLLVDGLWGSELRWLRPLGAMLGIPKGAESMLLAAVLGGYPAGAMQIGQAYREKRLRQTDAEHLLTFCSNAGPAFLFGITALQFSDMSSVWALWGIHILSALLTGRILRHRSEGTVALSPRNTSMPRILTGCVKTMGAICGWILLFQILLAFLDRWFFWYLPDPAQVMITGLLELSSGCCSLGRIRDEEIRFLICGGLLACGGLCVTMQTVSVLEGLSLKPYFKGKMIQTILSLGLSLLWLNLGWAAFLVALLLLPLNLKKRSGFLQLPDV